GGGRPARDYSDAGVSPQTPPFYMISRRRFLRLGARAAALQLMPEATDAMTAPRQPGRQAGRPRGHEFVFARLRYESGDWDYNPKVAANVLDSIVEDTSIPVYEEEVVIAAA